MFTDSAPRTAVVSFCNLNPLLTNLFTFNNVWKLTINIYQRNNTHSFLLFILGLADVQFYSGKVLDIKHGSKCYTKNPGWKNLSKVKNEFLTPEAQVTLLWNWIQLSTASDSSSGENVFIINFVHLLRHRKLRERAEQVTSCACWSRIK